MDLRTIKEIAGLYPIFSEVSLRWLLFNRDTNGLQEAIVKIGRKVFFDKDAFESWVRNQREVKG